MVVFAGTKWSVTATAGPNESVLHLPKSVAPKRPLLLRAHLCTRLMLLVWVHALIHVCLPNGPR